MLVPGTLAQLLARVKPLHQTVPALREAFFPTIHFCHLLTSNSTGHMDTWQVNPPTHQPHSYTTFRSNKREEQKQAAVDNKKRT